MSDEKEKKGFSGLSSLASDIEEATSGTTGRQSQKAQRKTTRGTPTPRSRSETPHRSDPGVVASESSRTPISGFWGTKWFWSMVGVGVLIWLFSALQEDSGKTSSLRAYTQPRSSPSYTPPAPASTRQTILDFSKPPVGQNNVHSVAEIRWCLREVIRIEVLRPMPTTNAQVNRFNAVVSEYNSRCRSFRYRRGALEQARREVEQQRAQIVSHVSPPW